MNNQQEKTKLWKTYGILMGVMIGGSALILGTQAGWNAIQQHMSKATTENTGSPSPATPSSPDTTTATSTAESSPSSSSITQEEATRLIERWQNAKGQIFAPPYDRQLGFELLTGSTYDRKIKRADGQESSVDWLENNNNFYTFQLQTVDDIKDFKLYGDTAILEAVVSEQRTLCHRNKNGQVKISGDSNTIFDRSLDRYYLELEQGQWKIADYNTIQSIQKSPNTSKSCQILY